jgi:hypothetical protein
MCWVGACLRQKWLPGAGSSEIMLLVTGYLRLVTVRGDGEVESHVRLVVKRYARGKSRPCVLCMHHHDEPSNDSAYNQAPDTQIHNQLRPAKPTTALIIKAGLIFVPPLINFSFHLSNLILLHLLCAQPFLQKYSHGFTFSACPILCNQMPVSSHLYLDTRHDASSRSNSKAEA